MKREDSVPNIARIASLGRQRNFSLPRFRRALAALSRHSDEAEVLCRVLADWTGLSLTAAEARREWDEIERSLATLREKLGAPLGLPAVLPPPEEEKEVKTAIGAARAKLARKELL